MPLNVPTKTHNAPTARAFALVSLLLLGILAVLFFRSFIHGEIVFSNDGPYGAINSAAGRLPGGFKGMWGDLNWFGSESVGASPDLSNTLAWFLQPLFFSKFYCPIAVFVVGLSAWVFLRQLGLATVACVVAGIATMLNSDFFSTAAWGVASQPICFAANFLALAAITHSSRSRHPWLWTIVAGFCVGWGVMEAFDIGAIFSMFTAAYVLYQSWNNEDTAPVKRKLGRGIGRVAVVATCASLIAIQTLNILIGTQIQGVAGTSQDKETKESQWSFATQWSVPKKEILQVLIPGIFGYRMDSPEGANYWGEIGQSPVIPELKKARDRGTDEQRQQANQMLAQYASLWRFSGSGFYAGVLVLIVACWAVCQSFRKQGSPFSAVQRRNIWFWFAVAVIGALLGFGKYAVFYRLFYSLPYVSTIRNPTKFMHVFSWALVILFGYGLHGLYRAYLQNANARAKHIFDWSRISEFDRRWLLCLFLFLGASMLSWIVYAGPSRPQLEKYIATVGFDAPSASVIGGYSISRVGWYVVLLTVATCLVAAIFTGQFAGARASWASVLLGGLVIFDLAHANFPWVVYWNVNYKYASNPIIDLLRDKPYEHRVTMLPFGNGSEALGHLQQVYSIEWVQQMFPCYNIQSLDVIMEPRVSQEKAKFLGALPYANIPNMLRTWELSNTRYLLGLGDGLINALNTQVDPREKRFRLLQSFNIVQKPGGPGIYPVDFTAVPATNGDLAVIEFTGALPRASLYSNWQVTNDDAALKLIASPDFDPHKTVLVANPIPAPPAGDTNNAASPGTVTIKPNYAPKRVELEADVKSPSVLLLNDKYSPHWHAWVNGQPAEMLRCNYIVRGLYLKPGHYDIVFRYQVPLIMFYISALAVIIFLGLSLWLGVDEHRTAQAATAPTSSPSGAKRAVPAATAKGKPVKV